MVLLKTYLTKLDLFRILQVLIWVKNMDRLIGGASRRYRLRGNMHPSLQMEEFKKRNRVIAISHFTVSFVLK